MKILIAADIFPPESGGPATYSAALANELMKMGDEVWVISLNSDGEKKLPNTYHVTRRKKVFKYIEYFWLLLKFSKNVDVIYSMGPVNAGLPALLAAKSRRKKLVVKVVGDYAWEQWQNKISNTEFQTSNFVAPENFSNVKVSFKINVLNYIERMVTQKANRVIVPSLYLKNIVTAWGVKSENIEVISNAVDLKKVIPINKPEKEKWIISVGRLVPWKGIGNLIEAVNELINDNHSSESGNLEIKLKIIGDGPEMDLLKWKIGKLGLNNEVEMLGNLDRDKALSYISSADVFVLNSAYEGLSHVLIEAVFLNVPILLSDIEANFLKPLDKYSVYFKALDYQQLKNKLINLFKNPSNYKMSVEDRSMFLEKFKFETMIKDTRKILCGN